MQQNSVSECRLDVTGDTTHWVPGKVAGVFSAVADRIPRRQATEIIREHCDGATSLVATTGKIGRELEALGHRSNQLYVVGSLGCASAIALGINKASGRRVIVLDGDGAVLMKMGVLGTIGRHASHRFVHVILDNEAHESTGAQATVSSSMDFCTIASGCGYRNSWRVDSAQTLATALDQALVIDGPNVIHVKVAIATDRNLKRPSFTPTQVKQQFFAWLSEPEIAADYAARGTY
jgi:phosphonopyruvate decarboxylase